MSAAGVNRYRFVIFSLHFLKNVILCEGCGSRALRLKRFQPFVHAFSML